MLFSFIQSPHSPWRPCVAVQFHSNFFCPRDSTPPNSKHKEMDELRKKKNMCRVLSGWCLMNPVWHGHPGTVYEPILFKVHNYHQLSLGSVLAEVCVQPRIWKKRKRMWGPFQLIFKKSTFNLCCCLCNHSYLIFWKSQNSICTTSFSGGPSYIFQKSNLLTKHHEIGRLDGLLTKPQESRPFLRRGLMVSIPSE